MPSHWFDPLAVMVVFCGTPVAAALRGGWRDVRATWQSIAAILAPRFDAPRVKAQLSRQIVAIEEVGLLRARPFAVPDDEFERLANTVLRRRSLDMLMAAHQAFATARAARAEAAVRLLDCATDLAPVMGLAGTLIALGGAGGEAPAGDGIGLAVGQAVVTTIYGLFAANFLFAPLAAAIARRADDEATARTALATWLGEQLALSSRSNAGDTALAVRQAA